MAYCELLKQNCLSLLEMQDWLIESNLAIILTNCYIKKGVKIIAIFVFDDFIFKYYMNSKT